MKFTTNISLEKLKRYKNKKYKVNKDNDLDI